MKTIFSLCLMLLSPLYLMAGLLTTSAQMDSVLLVDCPMDISAPADASNCEAIVNWTPPSLSGTSTQAVLSSNYEPGDAFPFGQTTVTYVVTDDSTGLADSCSFEVLVTEDISILSLGAVCFGD
ncbi:MAG: HYR domain-containing protein, partial [Bacteroidota bacterium]